MKNIITTLLLGFFAIGLQAQTSLEYPMPCFTNMPTGDIFYSVSTNNIYQHNKVERIIVKAEEEIFCYCIYYKNFEPNSYQKCLVADSSCSPSSLIYHYSIDGGFYSSDKKETLASAKVDMEEVSGWAMKFDAYIKDMALRSEVENPSASK